ncbi:phosphonate ABC transporter, periplasmic phosphonate-binding protein [Alkaliphilus metalliredigens QYMF]|uniref:Phosphonate ABC transporter, periplasmic phosphonate-binding protein n=1 Tax=Alkaliphilus metalliredigens (strain QYMF) TaxID=293826 RepID=A6TMF6_ALKMQ|nr:phosphate/phosphite/phosphonate ABC transporter substrate-binding protein [Alkaliphilus metalliredigens]ABR47374.1 phosphonate ABC transporter, periplasmic phosphonate-binding protein [Alkaliphilus metalliredigens QYMF]
MKAISVNKVSHFKKNVVLFGLISVLLVTLSILTGCSTGEPAPDDSSSPNTSTSTTEADPRSDWPKTIGFALLPTEDMEFLGKTYEPFIKYLEERLDVTIELHFPTDYTATVEAMRGGHVEISTFGPFSFVLAHDRANAEPVAIRLTTPEDEPTYESFIITRKSTGIETVADLKDKNFAYADPASTSGHLFPKAHIMEQMNLSLSEVDSDFFANTVFSGSHEASFLSVLNGDVDAAAIYDRAWTRFYERNSNHPNIDEMIVIDKTKPIPNSPFTVRGDLPESFKKELQDAMIDLINHQDDPEILAFLQETDAMGGYFLADMSTYQIVRDTATLLEMD